MLALFISTLILGLGIGLLGGIHIGFDACLEWRKENKYE